MTLCEAKYGQEVTISELRLTGVLKHRLLDMGITKQTKVTVVGSAPFGDPLQIRVRGYVLALRKRDAQNIIVY